MYRYSYCDYLEDRSLILLDKLLPPAKKQDGDMWHINHACGCKEFLIRGTDVGFKEKYTHVDASKCILHHDDIEEDAE